MADFVGAVDQGTTSTRFMVFDHGGNEVGRHQLEHEQILPAGRLGRARPDRDLGAHQHRASGRRSRAAGPQAARPRRARHHQPARDHRRLGHGAPAVRYYNAIVWQDTRTDRIASKLERDGRGDVIRRKAGLPPATYFSGGKIQWILENVDGVREAAERGDALFGTTDTLGALEPHRRRRRRRARHRPDQRQPHDADGPRDPRLGRRAARRSSASRARCCRQIKPSSYPEAYGTTPSQRPARRRGAAHRRPRRPAGRHRRPGLLRARRGQEHLRHRQLHAAQHRHGDRPLASPGCSPRSATSSATSHRLRARGLDRRHRLGGAVAARPARHHLRRRPRVESLARQVEDNGGVYFVPAFSGLFAPYWRSDARGAIVGLSRFNTNAHLARATLEAICYQSRDVVEAMAADSGVDARRAEGRRRHHGQRAVHADPGRRARRAGQPAGRGRDDRARRGVRGRARRRLLDGHRRAARELERGASAGSPQWSAEQRDEGYARWQKAVERTLGLGRRRTRSDTGRLRKDHHAIGCAVPRSAGGGAAGDGGRPSSTSWSSAAAWSGPDPPSTPPPAGSRSGWSRRATSPPARPAAPAS